jgi:hypothetical protein
MFTHPDYCPPILNVLASRHVGCPLILFDFFLRPLTLFGMLVRPLYPIRHIGCDRASAANRGVHTRLLHDGVLSLLLDLAEAHVGALLRFQNETHARTAVQACVVGGWVVVGGSEMHVYNDSATGMVGCCPALHHNQPLSKKQTANKFLTTIMYFCIHCHPFFARRVSERSFFHHVGLEQCGKHSVLHPHPLISFVPFSLILSTHCPPASKTLCTPHSYRARPRWSTNAPSTAHCVGRD